ncbi:MAG: DUF502 domain-containing protein [Candidatus Omnitrophica bacterium]|nr:DUF502 domain-containing protein [Candidatus Omnitrophota bacterium]
MLRRLFILGLTAVVPLVVTVYVIVGLFRFTDGILGKFLNRYIEAYLGYRIPGLGLIITVGIILLLGVFVRLSRMRVLRWVDKVFSKLPLANKIYLPVKRVVEFMFFEPKEKFRKVVLVEYPRKGIYSMGFITNDTLEELQVNPQKKSFNIFIPSSPSPLTGFTIIVPKEEVIFLDIGVEEALRFIVSGGVLNPGKLEG